MKATELIKEIVETVNDLGESDGGGVYYTVEFALENDDIDLESETRVQMDLKEIMRVKRLMDDNPRVLVLDKTDLSIARVLKKRGEFLDYYVMASSVKLTEELETLLLESKAHLEKFSRDFGFTPGWHHYNLVDAWIPWDSVRVANIELGEEGWI